MKRSTVVLAVFAFALGAAPAGAWPRVSGTWRVTFTPLNYDDKPLTVTWRLHPFCDFGACDFHVRSHHTGHQYRYRLLKSSGRYVNHIGAGAKPDAADCSRGGTVIARNVYFSDTSRTFRVIRAEGGQATRMKGLSYTHFTPTGEGRARNCPGGTFTDRVYAVKQ